jgi:hypothetical protein
MGEEVPRFKLEFNGAIQMEARPERLSSEAGGVLLREALEKLGFTRWLAERLEDPRAVELVTHPLEELLNTVLLLRAQGWRDQDDADALRDDPVLRLAASTRRGAAPLEESEPGVPDGLASQPTLSRLVRALSSEKNREVLREGLIELASRRLRACRNGHRPRYLTVDVDSLPIPVHGHQPGSEHNGHYGERIYHPLIASVAETGDLLDARLRPGNVHTAKGAVDFVFEVLDRVESRLCQVASLRMDAGFPEDNLLSALEERGTPYVARVKNNSVLDALAEPYLQRPPGRPPAEPRTWLHELSYQAASWSRARRVVLVVQERPGELFLHHFWLITSWLPSQLDAASLLEMYRQRGTAEGHMGELMNVLRPALSSTPRPKSHYRGLAPEEHVPSGDAFAQNEVTLLLNVLAYNLAHVLRTLLEAATGEGWSLQRVRERVLRLACRILCHGRRVTLVLERSAANLWQLLLRKLQALPTLAAAPP